MYMKTREEMRREISIKPGMEISEGKEKTGRLNGGNNEIEILFWNTVGIKNNDRDFWNKMEGYEIINLMETWIEDKDWKGLKIRLSTNFEWFNFRAKRVNKRGRAKGVF